MRTKIKDIYDLVKKIEEVSARAAHESKFAADEASGGLTASYSSAGDVEHARNSANLSIQKHNTIKDLIGELENALYSEIPARVETPCFVVVKINDSDEKGVYLVKNPIYITGPNLISPESPLGKAIIGCKEEDLFTYSFGEENYTGKILEIG